MCVGGIELKDVYIISPIIKSQAGDGFLSGVVEKDNKTMSHLRRRGINISCLTLIAEAQPRRGLLASWAERCSTVFSGFSISWQSRRLRLSGVNGSVHVKSIPATSLSYTHPHTYADTCRILI